MRRPIDFHTTKPLYVMLCNVFCHYSCVFPRPYCLQALALKVFTRNPPVDPEPLESHCLECLDEGRAYQACTASGQVCRRIMLTCFCGLCWVHRTGQVERIPPGRDKEGGGTRFSGRNKKCTPNFGEGKSGATLWARQGTTSEVECMDGCKPKRRIDSPSWDPLSASYNIWCLCAFHCRAFVLWQVISSRGRALMCKTCRHFAIESELERRAQCPLCHAPMR